MSEYLLVDIYSHQNKFLIFQATPHISFPIITLQVQKSLLKFYGV